MAITGSRKVPRPCTVDLICWCILNIEAAISKQCHKYEPAFAHKLWLREWDARIQTGSFTCRVDRDGSFIQTISDNDGAPQWLAVLYDSTDQKNNKMEIDMDMKCLEMLGFPPAAFSPFCCFYLPFYVNYDSTNYIWILHDVVWYQGVFPKQL